MKKSLIMIQIILIVVAAMVFATTSHSADSKVLRLISWTGYAPPELIAKFEKETGIKVEVTYSNNEEIMSKLRATRGGGI